MEKTNWIGIATLAKKEIGRFLAVYLQTIIAPVMTTFLFYLIFTLAFSGVEGRGSGIEGVSYIDFLVPGLIMMGMAQNAFANTSSSIVVGKVNGNIVDILMPPLSPAEILTGYVMGGIVRGTVVGLVSITVLVPFAGLSIVNPMYLITFSLLGTIMLALLGVLGGIWAEKFDHIAVVSNFLITPMTFLSGTFYSVDRLSPFWQDLAHINPFFYMIDGFRAGFIGVTDMPVMTGIFFLVGVNITLWIIGYVMLKSGYKIKS